jgi:DNA-binding MarR family transcriptional regulator
LRVPGQREVDPDDVLAHVPEILFDTAATVRVHGPTEAGLAELPPSQIEVLRLVSMHPGCGVSFITDQTKMRQGNASTTISSLVERGLVDKQADPDDGRAVRLLPTAKAIKDLRALRRVWHRRLQGALTQAGITDAEYREFARVLAAILSGLVEADEEPPPPVRSPRPHRRKRLG